MSHDFTLRNATLSDIPTIVAHRRAMFEEMGQANRAELDLMTERFQAWVTQKVHGGEYRHWFAIEENNQIVAGAGLWVLEWPPVPSDSSSRRTDVLNVYTCREYRRHGLAKRLTLATIDWCRENGISTVTLHASDAGRKLYESIGFLATNEMRIQL